MLFTESHSLLWEPYEALGGQNVEFQYVTAGFPFSWRSSIATSPRLTTTFILN
jgi:hypothetical protein